MSKIYLASGSPRRKELLTQIGISYEIMCSDVEEITTKTLPQDVVQELSYCKAKAVCRELEERVDGEKEFVVIGADTVVALGNQIMGKPKDKQDACRMLGSLQGNTHQVYTGVTICYKKEGKEPDFQNFYEKTDVIMCLMSIKEIEAYVETGEPMDKAGAYAIQGGCAAYIKGIQGDYYNVVGLPVSRLYQELKTRKLL